MQHVTVRTCALAESDHSRHPRMYAHVGHHEGRICITQKLRELPDNFVYAILLHELGHLALLPKEHSEHAADVSGGKLAGVTIHRCAWGPMRRLEFIATNDLLAARRAVYRLTDYRPLRGAPRLVVKAGRGCPLPVAHEPHG